MLKSTAVLLGLLITVAAVQFQGRANFPRKWSQLERSQSLGTREIDFTFHLRQCNFVALDQFFWEVSNPKSDMYGKYMTLEELNDLASCDPEDVKFVVDFVNRYDVKSVQVLGSSAVQVFTTVAVAEEMLSTRFHELVHKETGKMIIRQLGAVELPDHLLEVVNFVGGISEFFEDSKYQTVRNNKNHGRHLKTVSPTEYNPNTYDVADQWVTPIMLQDIYSIPDTPITTSNVLGIAAFDNDYDAFGFCRFQDLFGGYRNPPSVTYEGPVGGSDQVESDLDVQYSTAIASGASIEFHNHADNKWILDWATETVQNDERPYVWSISYGWPEAWQCIVVSNLTTDCPTGYTYQKYINATNYQLAALGALGVSVLVSAGDSGTPGFSYNCPVDVNVQAYNAETGNTTSECEFVFGAGATCGCGNVLVTFEYPNKTQVFCPIPSGFSGGAPGCVEIFGEAEGSGQSALCMEAIGQYQPTANVSNCQINTDYLAEDFLFFATCDCSVINDHKVTKKDVGTCTISAYEFDPSIGAAFLPDFPTASPYVLSVGATALQYTSAECSPSVFNPEIYAYTLDPAGFSGGGGFSSASPNFAAQEPFVQLYLSQNVANLPPASTFVKTNRAYPDVSFNGHNFIITLGLSAEFEGAEAMGYGGSIMPVGGTSASSPSFAGLVSRINDYLLSNGKPVLGPLTTLFYQMATEMPSAFNDIVPHNVDLLNTTILAGPNTACTEEACCIFGFPVAQGWDAATGLGTPNYPEMMRYIEQYWTAKK